MYIYIYIYVYIYIYMYVYIYIYMCICILAHVAVYVLLSMYECIETQAFLFDPTPKPVGNPKTLKSMFDSATFRIGSLQDRQETHEMLRNIIGAHRFSPDRALRRVCMILLVRAICNLILYAILTPQTLPQP